MFESIGNLRNIAYGYAPNIRRQVNMACDEIEQEIAERYMEMPVDADGVPIRVGDYLESEEYDGRPFPCRGLNVEVCKSGKRWTVCMSYDSYSGTSEYTSARRCHHVKPRTIEDVLGEAVGELFNADISTGSSEWDEVIAKYAEEIRGMMA